MKTRDKTLPTNPTGKINIAMAGGGTWGHVFPIRSLLQTLSSSSTYAEQIGTIYRFWSKDSLEQQTCNALQDSSSIKISFLPIISGKLRRELSLKAIFRNGSDFFKLLTGTVQSCHYLRKYQINTVFCKGGYVALPVVVAAKLLKKKLILHESDTHPGLVNHIASRRANVNFTAFPNVLPNAQVVGQLLSDDLFASSNAKHHTSQLLHWEISASKRPILFIMAGSQGAKTLYEVVAEILHRNQKITQAFQIVITLGQLNQELRASFENIQDSHITICDFLSQSQMGEIYQQADLCITRGGTTSLAEQKLFNIKSIIVPLPRTHDQADNAKRYAEHHADIVLDQNAPSFAWDLEQALLAHTQYHKKAPSTSPLKQIQETKKLVIEAIL